MNFGGVSLSGLVNNRRKFGPTLPGIAHMRHTHLKENFFTPGEGLHGADLAQDLARLVNLYGPENIAACLRRADRRLDRLPGAAQGLPRAVARICDQHGILLVFDEVITGFGRTGSAFAAQSFGVTPDLMTLAKGITNGAQPMGAVAVSEHVHDTIIGAAPEGAIECSTATPTRAPGVLRGRTRDAGHPAAKACSSAGSNLRRTSSTRCSGCGTCRWSPTSAATG